MRTARRALPAITPAPSGITLQNAASPGVVISNTAATVLVPLPGTATAGRYLMLCVGFVNASTPTFSNSGTGWSLLTSGAVSSYRYAVWAKLLNSSDVSAGSVTLSAGGTLTGPWTVVPRVYSGCSGSTVTPVLTSSATNVASLDSGQIVTDAANSLLVGYWLQPSTAGTSFTTWTQAPTSTSPAATMGNAITGCATDGVANNPAIGTWELPAPTNGGTYGPYTATSPQTRRTGALLFSLKP